jgi:predicted alpha-1,6-mannanase (GH76 family)
MTTTDPPVKGTVEGTGSPSVDWASRAEQLQDALLSHFWHPRRGLFSVAADSRPLLWVRWHYWWQAHALEVLVDRAARTGEPAHAALVLRHLRGIRRRTHRRWVDNDYHDDRAWMGCAMHRARVELGAATGAAEDTVYGQILDGLDPIAGAVTWRRSDAFVNAPTNCPTALLACWRRDVDIAESLLGWVERSLVDHDTGLVYDGIRGDVREDVVYTYNQGVTIGAHLALCQTVRDPGRAAEHLRLARRTADAALDRLTENGVFTEQGFGDGGLFKGILVRHLGALAEATGEPRYADALAINGAAMWANLDADGLAGPSWQRAEPRTVRDLSAQLSGVILAERLARMTGPGRPAATAGT